ncbi:DUF397 domain-containing protein [Streptomyces sp. NPDC127051]|uniref:DUF397 domain-containing protein n=1 Tax=Streptomyces sp. NPDC127051 TaxID=3347119 RepID=UPI0036574907
MSEGGERPLVWVKSSYTETNNCVEVAKPPGGVLVRDSKRPKGVRVSLAPSAWHRLVDWAKTHEV